MVTVASLLRIMDYVGSLDSSRDLQPICAKSFVNILHLVFQISKISTQKFFVLELNRASNRASVQQEQPSHLGIHQLAIFPCGSSLLPLCKVHQQQTRHPNLDGTRKPGARRFRARLGCPASRRLVWLETLILHQIEGLSWTIYSLLVQAVIMRQM